ncbi:hypothetical protein [Phenylobacterium sp.]|uniref:hypothetical protein n=1 Tax=Phenylobacterium sp. TaxID=1871053 RepID=UPI0035B4A9A9
MNASGKVWALALGGPLIGFGHLLAIYTLASLSDAPQAMDGGAVRLAMAATSTVSALANLWLVTLAWRDRLPPLAREPDVEASRFWRGVVGIGAGVSLVTVLYQGLPALFVPAG